MGRTILRNIIGILGFQILLLTWKLIKWGTVFVLVIMAISGTVAVLGSMVLGLASTF